MVQRVSTVSFEGIEVRPVDVQVQVAPGMPAFTLLYIIKLRYYVAHDDREARAYSYIRMSTPEQLKGHSKQAPA